MLTGVLISLGQSGYGVSEELEAAQRYRMHAEELRTIAAESHDPKSRDVLLQIAQDYDRMALSLQSIDRTNKVLRAHAPSK
jgi:predicted kinase